MYTAEKDLSALYINDCYVVLAVDGSSKCAAITCTRYSSFAVTDTGQVYIHVIVIGAHLYSLGYNYS